MKNAMTRLTIAAAAFMAAAGVASAQNMEAKIPFAFRASGKVFAAGTYQVRMARTPSGSETVVISSEQGGNELLTVAYPNGVAKPAWKSMGDAVLSFECGVSRCAMRTIWTGGSTAYLLPAPGLGKDEPTRTADIVMHNSPKAD